MMGQSQDREKVVPKCSGREISQIFSGKIRFRGNGIQERRPLECYQTNYIEFLGDSKILLKFLNVKKKTVLA